jgi:hypothetical protein
MTDTTKTPTTLPLQALVELVAERDTAREELAQTFGELSDAEHKAALLGQQDEQHRAEIRALTDRAEGAENIVTAVSRAAEEAQALAAERERQLGVEQRARRAAERELEPRRVDSFGARMFQAAPADDDATPRQRLEQVIGNGVGSASMAWEFTPAGTFDDALARSVTKGILAAVDAYMHAEAPAGVAEPGTANEILQRLAGVALTIEQTKAIVDLARSRSTGVHDAVDPEPAPERPFKVGDRVRHANKGLGVIVAADYGRESPYEVELDEPARQQPWHASTGLLELAEWQPGERIEVGTEVEYVNGGGNVVRPSQIGLRGKVSMLHADGSADVRGIPGSSMVYNLRRVS